MSLFFIYMILISNPNTTLAVSSLLSSKRLHTHKSAQRKANYRQVSRLDCALWGFHLLIDVKFEMEVGKIIKRIFNCPLKAQKMGYILVAEWSFSNFLPLWLQIQHFWFELTKTSSFAQSVIEVNFGNINEATVMLTLRQVFTLSN